MTARLLHIDAEQYHRDPCTVPSLSSHIAHTLVEQSPMHAFARHPRLGGFGSGPGTKAMTEGTLLHTLLLGKGKKIAPLNFPDFRTKAAKEARDAAIADGRLPVLQHDFAEMSATAEILRDHCRAQGIEFTGQSEVAVEWMADGGDGAVTCRSMFDHVFVDDGVIYDVKKALSANPRKLARAFIDYGYDIQYAAYTRALAALRPELAGRIDMMFVFVEIEPPYSVVPCRPDGALRHHGALRWELAVDRWKTCLESGNWPSYCDGPITLEAPAWITAGESL